MNYQGIVIGITAFLIIGLFHPIVIKAEYHIGKRVWPLFLIAGMILISLSMITVHQSISAIAGVAGFSSFWSIHEIFEQEKRVKKGWFPSNPRKQKANDTKQQSI